MTSAAAWFGRALSHVSLGSAARRLIEGTGRPAVELSDAELETAFALHAAELRARFGRLLMGWALVMNGLFAITDGPFLGGVPYAVEFIRTARLGALVGSLGTLVLLLGQRRVEGARLGACVATWCVACFIIGWAAGADPDISRLWFTDVEPLLFGTFVVPVTLRRRIVGVSLIAASLLAGLLAHRPEGIHSLYLPTTVCYLVFTAGVGIAFGQAFYYLVRSNFIHRTALEQKSAALDRQRARLADEVRERTEELRLLSQHLEQAREMESRRIARELHDELGQGVSALRLALSTTRRRFGKSPPSIEGNLEELDELLSRVAQGTRQAISHLHPQLLDHQDLATAARWLVESTGKRAELSVDLRIEGPDSPLVAEAPARSARRREVHAAAWRVLQEALTNVVNHARARRLEVSLRITDPAVELDVRDDGVGLPPAPEHRRGMGLVGMRERANALGGELSIAPAPGGGTALHCHLPIAEARPARQSPN